MNKKMVRIFLIASVLLVLTGCGKKESPKPVEGKYVSLSGDSYIILSDYNSESDKKNDKIGECKLQFINVDLSNFYNYSVNNSCSNYISKNYPDGCTKDKINEIMDMYKEQIDLNKQFVENSAKFMYFYSETEKGYGFMSEIEGSGFDGAYETYVTVEYCADDKSIICDEVKYILEE